MVVILSIYDSIQRMRCTLISSSKILLSNNGLQRSTLGSVLSAAAFWFSLLQKRKRSPMISVAEIDSLKETMYKHVCLVSLFKAIHKS